MTYKDGTAEGAVDDTETDVSTELENVEDDGSIDEEGDAELDTSMELEKNDEEASIDDDAGIEEL
jgi:hypothetical protein